MILYKYYFDTRTMSIQKVCIDVVEKEKSYVFTSNPHKRILKSNIDKVNPDWNELYSLNGDLSFAKSAFKKMFQNQITGFQHTIDILDRYVQELATS